VSVQLHQTGEVSVTNVASYRHVHDLALPVKGLGTVKGDIAWGGNWFFLVEEHGQELSLANAETLTDYCWRVRQALQALAISGAGGGQIDHIELCGPPISGGADSRNFVLCPGKAYDRSPCGTGTSAKLACLAADGKLAEGQEWIQESIIGSTFTGRYRRRGKEVIPTITGTAYVTGQTTLILDEADPFCWGIRPAKE
jgi:4-hydroxyproline epimerase